MPIIPTRSAEGQDELNRRARGLSQRHRTVLLLVDGRRSVEQVRQMAQQAGASASCFDELVELGLVGLVQPAAAQAVDIALPAVAAEPPELPAADEAAAVTTRDSALEAARDLLVQALRAEAPVAGSITIMKVKRAASRREMADLLDDVQAKLSKARTGMAHVTRRARDLLDGVDAAVSGT